MNVISWKNFIELSSKLPVPKRVLNLASALFVIGISLNCSHLEVKEIPKTANPSTEISHLENRLIEAESKQVHVLSPQYYKSATDALKKSQESRTDNDDNAEILQHVATGIANLEKAEHISTISQTTLQEVLAARSDAIDAKAPVLMEKEYGQADQRLTKITAAIEKNDLSEAEKGRAELGQTYRDIELQAIKKDKLSKAKSSFEEAKRENAEKKSKRTFQVASQSILAAETYINEHRHDKFGIQKHADQATWNANRLLMINRKVKGNENADPESLVLELENRKEKLDQSIKGQIESEKDLAEQENITDSLRSTNQEFEKRDLYIARMEAAKSLFSAGEADVYRDGDKLIIRLKQLGFPSGKATLARRNFSLLGKVQRVMEDLEFSQVTIQGHTDSFGSKIANQKLSDQRAQAISSYFVSNGIPMESIRVEGYSDNKPLAPNKTKEGRAKNRRVDVIIESKAQ